MPTQDRSMSQISHVSAPSLISLQNRGKLASSQISQLHRKTQESTSSFTCQSDPKNDPSFFHGCVDAPEFVPFKHQRRNEDVLPRRNSRRNSITDTSKKQTPPLSDDSFSTVTSSGSSSPNDPPRVQRKPQKMTRRTCRRTRRLRRVVRATPAVEEEEDSQRLPTKKEEEGEEEKRDTATRSHENKVSSSSSSSSASSPSRAGTIRHCHHSKSYRPSNSPISRRTTSTTKLTMDRMEHFAFPREDLGLYDSFSTSIWNPVTYKIGFRDWNWHMDNKTLYGY